MPELPEVEAVCRKLGREAIRAQIASAHIERLRITLPQAAADVEGLVAGRRIEAVERRGKNILIALTGGLTLHVHLRMTGDLRVIPDYRLRPHAASAWFEFSDGRALVFEDRRGLGTLRLYDAAKRDALLAGLGPEPLSRQFTAAAFMRAARKSRLPAKLYLMDQRRIAGLGNIYAAEALYAAGVDPRRPVGALREEKLRLLHRAIVRILRDAVKSACLAYSGPGGFSEAEEFSTAVYGREAEPCFQCRSKIRRITQGGRSTYYCPRCQR